MSWLETMISQVNIFGLGADPIAIAFALMVTVFINQKLMQKGKYTNAVMTFLLTYGLMFAGGVASVLMLFIGAVVVLIVGVVLAEGMKS